MEKPESSYCRLCAELTPNDKIFDLLSDSKRSREVVEKLTRLKHSFINMFRDNEMPKTVCFICLDSLYRAIAFVEKVESSQDVLKSILNIKREPSCSEDDDDDIDCSSSFEADNIKEERAHKLKIRIKKEKEQECRITCKHEGKTRRYKKRRPPSSSDDDSESDMSWKDFSWMCAFCSTTFPSAEDLRKHAMDCHDSCTAYKCADCNIRKLKLEPFLAHVMRHKKFLKRSCHICSMKFTRKTDVEKHRKNHTKFKNICVGCHMSFKYVKELVEHKSKYYTDKRATRVIRPLDESDLVCKVCAKKFKTRSILQAHVLIHTERRRDHTCDICGKCFYNKDTLMSHLIVHNESRPHQCEICKFSFKTIGQLRMHIGTHDGQRPFACEQCGKRFRLRKNLSSHMIIHSDTLPFTCEFCNKGFRFKTILNQHIRQHTGVKPYSCSLCQRAFTNWSNYNKHMKRRHGMEMAKKKHTPDGVFPINPMTGEVIIAPLPDNTEEWKKSVLQRKLQRKTDAGNSNSQSPMETLVPPTQSQPITPAEQHQMSQPLQHLSPLPLLSQPTHSAHPAHTHPAHSTHSTHPMHNLNPRVTSSNVSSSPNMLPLMAAHSQSVPPIPPAHFPIYSHSSSRSN
ncbi:hypothetical protein JYU34_001307 [Plutella xylostella]|uniref:Uncharacterized protein n=1 Tax=Plutella xylostella TaxID=51655 RepID=A0ABQ7R6I3_PLUXY|nr:hypothetical protein JYU34_001307 [Plutella xylostella]